MSASAQFQQATSQALPPKKTRQRYRREADDLDTAARGGYADPYDYGEYPSGSISANTAAARQSPHSVPASPDRGTATSSGLAPADVQRTTRQRPPSYDVSTEQLSRGSLSGERRRPPQGNTQAYSPVQPPVQAPAGSRSMPAGNALLRQTQAHQVASPPRAPQNQSYSQPDHSPTGQPQPTQTSALATGASISRLKTPSVVESVLQPLSLKVQEYDRLMRKAQDDMQRLDDELRALQQRRDEAENRFLDAEARHKDWQQQYEGVRRTLNKEAPLTAPTAPAPQARINEPLPIHGIQHQDITHDDVDDDDDDDDDDNEPVYKRPWSVNHQSSFTSTKSKGRRSKLFSSIFGA